MISIVERLKNYDYSYNLGLPEITDGEYDRIKTDAKAQFPDDPYFTTVGAVLSGEKVKLPFVLGSLDKIKDDGSYEKWTQKYIDEMLVYWAKLDGVSLYVEYLRGKFHRATTRGDGEYGQDVTDKARLFCRPRLDSTATVKLRGEAMLTGTRHLELGYKTRRNGTAGLLNSDSTVNCQHIEVVYYEVIEDSEGVREYESGRCSRIKELGLETAPMQMGKNVSAAEVIEFLREWKTTQRYDIDGVVITPNHSEREDAYYPDNKVAFKVNEEATLCHVNGLEWSVGRTGRVTPVVVIVPMEIGGVTVERATGFNADFVVDNGIEAGAIIGIYRSGDVIPYIDYVEESVQSTYDVVCPSCERELVHKGVDLVCLNNNCPDQNLQIVEYFLRTLGCENVTKVTLKKLGVNSVRDAYDLEEFDIADLEGFGIRRAEQVVSEIRKTLKTTPDKLLASFGISGIGLNSSREILKVHEFEDIWNLNFSDFIAIDGIGETLAHNLITSLPSRRGMYDYLLSEGLQWASSTNTLRGKVFCLTGNGTVKRDLLVRMIEENGGYVKGMSKKVDVLVTANPDSNSGKAKKAREYVAAGAAIDIIGYETLLEMLEY